MNSIWLRAGITLQADDDMLNKILSGDVAALRKALDSGNWKFEGETYIPEVSITERLQDHFKITDVGDVEFEIWDETQFAINY